MYTVKHGGTIQKGDLVAVCNTNDFCIGIYYGRGKGGTFQYFYPGAAIHAKDSYDNKVLNHGIETVGPFKIGSIWKCYVNSPRDTRIMKLNRDNITDQQTIDQILESKEILKEFNIEVNY
jgi:hypothetical protein